MSHALKPKWHRPQNVLLLLLALLLLLQGCTAAQTHAIERTFVLVVILLGTGFVGSFTILALIMTLVLSKEIRQDPKPSIWPSLLGVLAVVLGLIWVVFAIGWFWEDEWVFLLLIPLGNLGIAIAFLVKAIRDRLAGFAYGKDSPTAATFD